MPTPPARLIGKGRFPQEWNYINDWFKALASNWFRSDDTINLEVNEDHCLLSAVDPDTIRPAKLLEDIPNGEDGEAEILVFDESVPDYVVPDGGIKLIVRNDFNQDAEEGEEVIIGRILDGNWEIISKDNTPPPGFRMVMGPILSELGRGGEVQMRVVHITPETDEPYDSIQYVRDLGPQIQNCILLNSGNVVTATQAEPGPTPGGGPTPGNFGWLISYDCDSVRNICPPPVNGPSNGDDDDDDDDDDDNGNGGGPPPQPGDCILYRRTRPDEPAVVGCNCRSIGISPVRCTGSVGLQPKIAVDINFGTGLPQNIICMPCGVECDPGC